MWAVRVGDVAFGLFAVLAFPFCLWMAIRDSVFRWVVVPHYLRRWAKEGGSQLVRRERRRLRTGPFNHDGDPRHVFIYRVEVIDRDGLPRSGWARFEADFFY